MIIQEQVNNLIHTYSDQGLRIERDGVLYDDALDPIGTQRTYTESTGMIEDYATETDYIDALKTLGVDIEEASE